MRDVFSRRVVRSSMQGESRRVSSERRVVYLIGAGGSHACVKALGSPTVRTNGEHLKHRVRVSQSNPLAQEPDKVNRPGFSGNLSC